MAWQNIELPIPTGELSDFSYCEMTNYDTNYQSTSPSGVSFVESWNYTVSSAQTLPDIYVFGDADNGLFRDGGWNDYSMYWHRKVNNVADNRQLGTNFFAWDRYVQYGSYEKVSLIACINEETHRGAICFLQHNYNGNLGQHTYRFRTSPQNNTEYLYNALIEATPTPPIVYNWQSVPSISGKNGILQSLVQIKEEALNDGEPVSEAPVLSFDSLGNINIPSVIDEQMPVDPDKLTSITAVYLIPKLSVGTYSKIQLWLKKKNIPTSEEDADYVVNLTEPTNILRIGSASVNRLQESTKYIAIVAVEDEIGTTAQSEPAEIVTGKIPGIFKIVIATSSGVKDELKEVIVVEKQ